MTRPKKTTKKTGDISPKLAIVQETIQQDTHDALDIDRVVTEVRVVKKNPIFTIRAWNSWDDEQCEQPIYLEDLKSAEIGKKWDVSTNVVGRSEGVALLVKTKLGCLVRHYVDDTETTVDYIWVDWSQM